jgi:hypothetical protein
MESEISMHQDDDFILPYYFEFMKVSIENEKYYQKIEINYNIPGANSKIINLILIRNYKYMGDDKYNFI